MDNRNYNLDFVKGFLVIAMVLYHTISNCTIAGYDGTKYLRFVTGAFIFISGYIIAVYYQKKFFQDKKCVCARLITRGIKLLIIFTVLNVVINLLGIQSSKVHEFNIDIFFLNLNDIYISGNSRYSVFQILVPIAYLLIISPLFLTFSRWKLSILIGIFILMIIHEIFSIKSFNLYGLIIGFVGISAGMFFSKHETYKIKSQIAAAALFGLCILLMKYFDKTIISYALGVAVLLKSVFDFSQTLDMNKRFNKIIILLGQYSLIAYIAQILFIQIIYKLFILQRSQINYKTFIVTFIVCIQLIIFCLLLNILRRKFKLIDKIYAIIFS